MAEGFVAATMAPRVHAELFCTPRRIIGVAAVIRVREFMKNLITAEREARRNANRYNRPATSTGK